jgi:hypothetical protein
MHILRQEMVLVRRLLTRHTKARFSIAVAIGVGYALCEMA